jgi:hypothetical protein
VEATNDGQVDQALMSAALLQGFRWGVEIMRNREGEEG